MTFRINRRTFAALIGAAMTFPAITTLASDFPERPVTMIIMSSEGGGMDRASRLVGDAMASRLGQPIKYVNRAGASGEIALRMFLATEDNGYTIFSGNLPTLMLGFGSKPQDYEFSAKVSWLGAYLRDPAILATSSKSPYKSAADVIADARSRQIRVGVANWSSVQTLALLQLAETTGAQLEIIPYSGFKKAATAMLGGHIEAAVGNLAAIEKLGENARSLGIFQEETPDGTDHVPLETALGMPVQNSASIRALAVHESLKTSHPERYARLLDAYNAVVADPAFAESFTSIQAKPGQKISWSEDDVEKEGIRILETLNNFRTLFEQGK
jgi:tripartite-type tricarboxylate transporter receptor subunit TctC